MKTTRLILILGLTLAAFSAQFARAASSNLKQLIDTQGHLIHGDKKFASFALAGPVDTANFEVETVDMAGNLIGLKFIGPFVADGAVLDLTLRYTVETTSGLPLIKSIYQQFEFNSTGNGGYVLITETAWDENFGLGNEAAKSTLGPLDLVDPAEEPVEGDHLQIDPPLNKVWVQKDILLHPDDAQSSVEATTITQMFEQEGDDKPCPPKPDSVICTRTVWDWLKIPNDWPAPYAPDQLIETLFANATLHPGAAGKTLLQTLNGEAGSGEVPFLLKHGVAALLNIATPGVTFGMAEQEVVDAVNDALADGTYAKMKALKDCLQLLNEPGDKCIPAPPPACPRTVWDWLKIPAAWPMPYAPDQVIESVFADAAQIPDAVGKTLLETLNGEAGSGEVPFLLKHGVAALLNIATPGVQYPWTAQEVIDAVNDHLLNATEAEQKALKAMLQQANEGNGNCVPIPPPACPKRTAYHKQFVIFWPAGYDHYQPLESVFGEVANYPDAVGKTLLQALHDKAGTGAVKDMLKQAVAALLNAASPGVYFPWSESEVIDAVNSALQQGDDIELAALADQLQDANQGDKDCGKTMAPPVPPKPPQGTRCPWEAEDWEDEDDSWPAPYQPNQTVESVFAAASLYPKAAAASLLDAVDGDAGSGEVEDLLEEAVAALLNAADPEIAYPFSVADVIDAVNAVLTSGDEDDMEDLEDLFEDANEDDDDCD